MKNIHLLPTEKTSRLSRDKNNRNLFINTSKDFLFNAENLEYLNIYITSDEEIKEGDWVYYENGYLKGVHKVVNGQRPKTMFLKKIILTTDQDLIKDGVQSIDDEFLEWFVKNPSCEFVEVKSESSKKFGLWKPECYPQIYKIIIPQEEPNQELLPDFKITKNIFDFVSNLSDTNKEEPNQDKWEQLRGEGLDQPLTSWDEIKQHVGLINDNIDEFDKAAQEYFERKSKFKQDLNDDIHEAHQTGRAMKQEESKQECTCGVCDNCEEQETIQILKEAKENALKQETIEEAANNFAKLLGNKHETIFALEENAFIEGAKWQSERMYNEDEVEKMVRAAYTFGEKEFKYFGAFKEWFEQFKKK
jgi:hypothetical protein